MDHDTKWARQAQRELRSLLNEWDPIGVFDPADEDDEVGPVDEYDCLCDPLMSHLPRGDSRAELAESLRDELRGHFGLDPWVITTT